MRMGLLALAALAVCGGCETARREAGATAVVQRLYRDYAWEAQENRPSPGRHPLVEEPAAVLGRYFDAELVGLLLKDRACVEQTKEVCNLDFVPMWASQDPGAEDLRISPTGDPAVVEVSFRYPSDHTAVEMSYRLVRTGGGWRIHDIVYEDGGSLRKMLKQ